MSNQCLHAISFVNNFTYFNTNFIMLIRNYGILMNKWFISVTHFFHKNVIQYNGRPFQSVDEMNLKLIENWNACIEPQGTVFFLGDFGFGATDVLADLCSQLHGYKICIRGNHDGTPKELFYDCL